MDTLPGLGGDDVGTHTYGVAELADRVTEAIRRAFPAEIWVAGEMRDLRTKELRGGLPGSRHVYFSLVEPGAPGAPEVVVPVVLWDSHRRTVNRRLLRHGDTTPLVKMGEGVQVRIRGTLEVYGPRGQVQLKMTAIDPAHTLGLLETERDRVLGVLAAEGLADTNAALALPVVPWRIGLVTAHGSAAAADFLHELEASGLHWQVLLAATRVQGTGADHGVAAAVATLARRQVDVVAVVRGGGARTELAVFDAEVVARAIAGAPVPVLTGIGHEVDTSVADLVAHTRHKTPTACAAALVARARAAAERVERAYAGIAATGERRLRDADRLVEAHGRQVVATARRRLAEADRHQAERGHRLTTGTTAGTAVALTRLERAATRLEDRAGLRLRGAAQRVDGASARLPDTARRRLHAAGDRLDAHDAVVRALDPARALARGWTITRDQQGRAVRTADAARRAGTLRTSFADGEVASQVLDAAALPAPPPPTAEEPDDA